MRFKASTGLRCFLPMTNGISGVESALRFSQCKAECIRHSDTYGFRIPTQLRGNGDVLCILNVMGIYNL
jgi:hypothetical protein